MDWNSEDSEPLALLTEARLYDRARTMAPAGCAVTDVERARTSSPDGAWDSRRGACKPLVDRRKAKILSNL